MTNELVKEYHALFNDFPLPPPLDYGHDYMDDETFFGHVKDAINSGNPLDWRAILGPSLIEKPGKNFS